MNHRELARRIAAAMRDDGIKKPVSFPKKVFHISDDEGNKKDFVVRKSEKGVLFTADDINAVILTGIRVIEDALKRGEDITIRNFGSLFLHHRKARSTKNPSTGEPVIIDARYTAKFSPGNGLRLCAKMFELSLDEKVCEPTPIDDEEEGGA